MLLKCAIKNCTNRGILQKNGVWINISLYSSAITDCRAIEDESNVDSKCAPYQLSDSSWKKWWQKGSVGKHPGRCNLPSITIPSRLNASAKLYLEQCNDVVVKTVAEKLNTCLLNQRTCKEKNFNKKQSDELIAAASRSDMLPPVKSEVVALVNLPLPSFKRILKSNLSLQKTTQPYKRKQIVYDQYNASAYLVSRSPACYAVSLRVMSEIKKKRPDFQPNTILDFGSGTGMSTWAANSLWNDTLTQYVCIDSSKHMNDLAFFLFSGGNYDRPLPGLFIRHSVPSSITGLYDIVIASYSLSELPSDKERIALLKMLWSKTNQYLILIENGNFYGYYVMMEARNLLLNGLEGADRKNANVWKNFSSPAKIFSPCPHHWDCPMWGTQSSCKFSQKYVVPDYAKKYGYKDPGVEKFSYIVFEKTAINHKSSWPRVISNPHVGRHAVCHICTPEGNIEHVTITKSKNGTDLTQVVKKSKLGDSIPLSPLDKKISFE